MTNKSFDQLVIGDVIIDGQGARHTVIEIGGWEVFDDVWDGKTIVSARGRRIFTDTYPRGGIVDGQGYTAEDMKTATFRVEAGK